MKLFGLTDGRHLSLPNQDATLPGLPLEVMRFLAGASLSVEALEVSRLNALEEANTGGCRGLIVLFLVVTDEGERGNGVVRAFADGFRPFSGGLLRGAQCAVEQVRRQVGG